MFHNEAKINMFKLNKIWKWMCTNPVLSGLYYDSCLNYFRSVFCKLGGYRDALMFHEGEAITFNPQAFVQSRPVSMQPFLENMLHLQIFQQVCHVFNMLVIYTLFVLISSIFHQLNIRCDHSRGWCGRSCLPKLSPLSLFQAQGVVVSHI